MTCKAIDHLLVQECWSHWSRRNPTSSSSPSEESSSASLSLPKSSSGYNIKSLNQMPHFLSHYCFLTLKLLWVCFRKVGISTVICCTWWNCNLGAVNVTENLPLVAKLFTFNSQQQAEHSLWTLWLVFTAACQISPAASPEILHHTVWRTWLFIAYTQMKDDYNTNSHHLTYTFVFKRLGEWHWSLSGVKRLMTVTLCKLPPGSGSLVVN